jgi:hypothetical protein
MNRQESVDARADRHGNKARNRAGEMFEQYRRWKYWLKAFGCPIEREDKYGRMFQMDHWDVRHSKHSKQRICKKGRERGLKGMWNLKGGNCGWMGNSIIRKGETVELVQGHLGAEGWLKEERCKIAKGTKGIKGKGEEEYMIEIEMGNDGLVAKFGRASDIILIMHIRRLSASNFVETIGFYAVS